MGLHYKSQDPRVIIGSKTPAGVRTGITLAATYGSTEDTQPLKSFSTAGYSKLALAVNYTMGATETTNSIQSRIESSPDGINWYRLSIDTTVTSSTLTAREWTFTGADAAAATIDIILDIAYKYMRVAFKETGVVTNFGNVFCEATLSGV